MEIKVEQKQLTRERERGGENLVKEQVNSGDGSVEASAERC